MHDIWNPWHGCIKKSEGCANCYMYALDKVRGQDGHNIYKVKNNFNYPLQRHSNGTYKVQSGTMLRVCMTSDFFLEEADVWRDEAWKIMEKRSDVVFMLLTKRPERVSKCLPKNWGSGWENIFFNVTTENQIRADERIPILFELPFKHKGIMVAPFIGPVSIKKYLAEQQIEQVIVAGENYDGARPLHYEWVKQIYEECRSADIHFCFFETGTKWIVNGNLHLMRTKADRKTAAQKTGFQHDGKPIHFNLYTQQLNLF